MDAEKFHQGEIVMKLKSHVRRTESWLSANLQYKRVLMKTPFLQSRLVVRKIYVFPG